MSLVWAPENKSSASCRLLLDRPVSEFEVKVIVLVGLFLGFQLLEGVLTPWHEQRGAAPARRRLSVSRGDPDAQLDWVDCEHWDVFSVWSGRNTMTPEERRGARRAEAARSEARIEEEQRRRVGDRTDSELIQTGNRFSP